VYIEKKGKVKKVGSGSRFVYLLAGDFWKLMDIQAK